MKRAALILPVLVLAAACGPAPAPRPAVRGLYGFDPGSEIFRNAPPCEIASRLSDWNVNAVFMSASGSQRSVRDEFRDAGIKVFVELACFTGARHWKSHPESRPINADGEPIRKIKWYTGVCPSQDWLRRRLIQRAVGIAKSGVDGIWLDFIRYPAHWEVPDPLLEQTCFCPVCLKNFEKATGLQTEGKSAAEKARWILKYHRKEWIRFKTGVIAGFAGELRRAVHAESPGVLIGLFAVPWTEKELSGAILEIIGQDIRLLARSVDVFSPMVYYPLMGRRPEWMADITAYFRRRTGKPVWPIIFAGDSGHTLSGAELERSIEIAGKNAEGILVLSFPNVVKGGNLPALRRAFK